MRTKPTYLYHYTTIDGFMGIVEKKELWATDVRYLNDWTEFHHGTRIWKRALQKKLGVMKQDEPLRDTFESLLAGTDSIDSQSLPICCVCSFSACENDLSQWRAYCPDGGYAIGFPREELEDCGAQQSFSLIQCRYRMRDSVDIVAKDDRSAKVIDMALTQMAHFMMAASYKNRKFQAEKEWRFYSFWGLESCDFRKCGNCLVPYVRLQLNNPALWEDVRIIVGPFLRETDDLRVTSIKMFLRKHGIPDSCIGNVKASGIPYRTALRG